NLPAFLGRLEATLQGGRFMVQFREPEWAANAPPEEVYQGFLQVLACCRRYGAKCLVNSVHPEGWRELADGVHWREVDAVQAVAMFPASPDSGLANRPGRFRSDSAQAPDVDAHLKPWPLMG